MSGYGKREIFFRTEGRGRKLCRANPKSVGDRNMLPRLREAKTAKRVTKPCKWHFDWNGKFLSTLEQKLQ
jgi:hypothetical protein